MSDNNRVKAVLDVMSKHRIGKEIFVKFFNMPKKELLEILREICGDRVTKDVFEDSSNVYKELTNDEPTKLTVASWNKVTITPFGIDYQREHSTSETIVEFNRFFKLPE